MFFHSFIPSPGISEWGGEAHLEFFKTGTKMDNLSDFLHILNISACFKAIGGGKANFWGHFQE